MKASAIAFAAIAAGFAALIAKTPSAATVKVEGVAFAPTLTAGNGSLSLGGCGAREVMFTSVYVPALYLPCPGMKRTRIFAAETPKAVQLKIVYDGTLPQDIPESWREPLERMAQSEVERAVRNIFEKFQSGDRVTVQYAPDTGTTVDVNGKVIRTTGSGALMLPLLELWIGDQAVSDNLRRLMLSGSCDGEDDGWC